MKVPAVYMLSNKRNGTLYTGVTSNLPQRIYQHKNKLVKSFSSKYGCDKLVYYQGFETMEQAIIREKQIKGGSRKKKLDLVETMNPGWDDLYEQLLSDY
ncbi:MAG: GIY-YIG nuclease family protein [Deltaproteobacteria bacterium]|nr:GIY-YIG nuclease family protein [Deltaproteobacteria bacterium]